MEKINKPVVEIYNICKPLTEIMEDAYWSFSIERSLNTINNYNKNKNHIKFQESGLLDFKCFKEPKEFIKMFKEIIEQLEQLDKQFKEELR